MYRVSLGLVCLLMSILLIARNLDFLPDPDAAAVSRRQAVCESLAIECALLAHRKEKPATAVAFARTLAKRNPDIVSIAVRDPAGKLVIDVGNHATHWNEEQREHATPTQMSAVIPQDNGSLWATAEVCFQQLPYSGWWRYFGGSLFPLFMFVWAAWFIVTTLYLRAVFRRVDMAQAKVVPQQVRGTLNTLAEGVLVLNKDGVIALANDAFARALGTSAESLSGKKVSDLPWDPGAKELQGDEYPWVRVLRDAVPQMGQVLGLRSNSDGKTLSVNSTPIMDKGKCRGALATFDDLTAVEKARAAAVAATKAKSEFLANVSHEIRTPMNAIMGMTELVLEGGQLTSEHRECLEIVGESAGSLLEVINDLLDLSKIEAGKFDLDPIDFDLRAMLDDTLQGLALRAYKKGLELGCDVARDVPDVLVGDPTRLRQVVVNLVGNAIKFTSHGEVFVRVRVERSEHGQAQLHFAIIDTGIGILPNKLKAVFEPFTQADGSTTRKFGGTGLGLTISSHLVRLMRGEIWAESEVDRGSEFHFTARFGIPVHSDACITLPDVPFIDNLAVLVVEDHPTVRHILGEILTGFGMLPTLVENAENAIPVLERFAAKGDSFPLVLVDATLQGTDGFALTEQILNRRLAGVAMVMISSPEIMQDIDRCRRIGATHLRKPIKRSDLIRALRHIVDPAYASKAVVRPEPRLMPTVNARDLKILVVEDNPFNQKVSAMKLERWGHHVQLVSSGREALEVLQEKSFDLMLTDVQMPDMDGYELTRTVRERELTSQYRLPIVAMTAHAMKGIRERCLDAGMDDYVSKPIRDEDLLNAINRVVPPKNEAIEDTTFTRRQDTAEEFVLPAAEPSFDEATVLGRVGGNRDVLQQLIGVFYQDCNNLMERLHAAIKENNAHAVRSAAHTIKGMVAFFGAKVATETAAKLEQAGFREELASGHQLFSALARELIGLEAALSNFAPSPPEGWHLGLGSRSNEDVFSPAGAF